MNIVTQLLCFLAIAVQINFLSISQLGLLGLVLTICFLALKSQGFLRLLKRLKWVYISMLLIFAFNTPGEHVMGWPFELSPTYEGLRAGLLQVCRIIIMLATVSLLLANNSKQRLISGFYYLLYPFKLFRLNAECFAARLWLTLHYVEDTLEDTKNQSSKLSLQQQFRDIFNAVAINEVSQDEMVITIEKPHFRFIDFAVLLLLTLMIFSRIFKGL